MWLVALLVVLAAPRPAALFVVAGRSAPPTIDDPAARARWSASRARSRSSSSAPGAQLDDADHHARAERHDAFRCSRSSAPQIGDDRARRTPIICESRGRSASRACPSCSRARRASSSTASRRRSCRCATLSSQRDAATCRCASSRRASRSLSTHHYVNHGGAEMVVYRATPPDVQSGVRVGDVEYAGLPGERRRADRRRPVDARSPSSRCSTTRISRRPIVVVRARRSRQRGHGVVRRQGLREAVPPQPHRDRRPLPAARRARDPRALARTRASRRPTGDLVSDFLKINGDLRRLNARARSRHCRRGTSPHAPVDGRVRAARQLAGRGELRRPPHLRLQGQGSRPAGAPRLRPGGDGAVPVAAANAGTVRASPTGSASTATASSSTTAWAWRRSTATCRRSTSRWATRSRKGQVLGRSGMTGLAGGDHLHFTMLVGGRPVNPVEWWDPHWIQDRVERKLRSRTPWRLRAPRPAERPDERLWSQMKHSSESLE